jgi:hypothetical protein
VSRPTSLTEFAGIGDSLAERLRETGIETPADVAAATVARLVEVDGISARLARSLKTQAGRPATRTEGAAGAAVAPGDWTVTERQAAHVEALGLGDAEELVDATAADLRDRLEPFERFHLPFFRRICGRVVAEDPDSGDLRPVPNATVRVYDTDCSFLGHFPVGSPFCWFYPFGSRRERIAETRTDACGRFCVYVPWWDVDRVVRYRLERVCLREVVRPRLEDLLDPEQGPIPDPDGPGPWPDGPGPRPGGPRFARRPSLDVDFDSAGRFTALANRVDRDLAADVAALSDDRGFGTERTPLTRLLDRPAFTDPVRPPLPAPLRGADDWTDLNDYEFGVDPEVLDLVDPHDALGPFLRCHYVRIPEWETVYDVPDITFEVTQDTDGDGTEETIYDEGYFAVRWDDPPSEVELLADPTARTVSSCRAPDGELFVCTDPSIVSAEDMALRRPYHEPDSAHTTSPAAGYQRLVNRPRDATTGTRRATGEAPYAGTLQLHGCSRVGDATRYRVVYRYKPDADAADWTATQPFTGLHWHVPVLFDGDPYPVEPGADGWYETLTVTALENHYGQNFAADEPSDLVVFPYLLLQWPTGRYPNGRYDLRVQVGVDDGSGGTTVTQTSDWMPMVVDNTRPVARIESLEWWGASDSPSEAVDLLATDPGGDPTCPVIRREDEAVHVRVGYHVSAPHYRDMRLRILGCTPSGGTSVENPSIESAAPANGPLGTATTYRHWHADPTDTTRTGTVTFTIDASDPDGSYTVALDAYTRAYNPGANPMNPDWDSDAHVRRRHPRQGIAVVTQ